MICRHVAQLSVRRLHNSILNAGPRASIPNCPTISDMETIALGSLIVPRIFNGFSSPGKPSFSLRIRWQCLFLYIQHDEPYPRARSDAKRSVISRRDLLHLMLQMQRKKTACLAMINYWIYACLGYDLLSFFFRGEFSFIITQPITMEVQSRFFRISFQEPISWVASATVNLKKSRATSSAPQNGVPCPIIFSFTAPAPLDWLLIHSVIYMYPHYDAYIWYNSRLMDLSTPWVL